MGCVFRYFDAKSYIKIKGKMLKEDKGVFTVSTFTLAVAICKRSASEMIQIK